jgi:hypothetical protein
MNARLRKAHWRYTDLEGRRWLFRLDPIRGCLLARVARGKDHWVPLSVLVGFMSQCPAPDGSPVPEDHRQLKLL